MNIHWLGTPIAHFQLHVCVVHSALCVHVRQETLAIPSNLLEWHIHFLLFHTIAACVIISIHSSQLNGILQDDEVNAVFFAVILIPNPVEMESIWLFCWYSSDFILLFASLLR